jgi:hypothetical protein
MKKSKDNIIHVGTDYGICGDEICITLYKRRVTKGGNVQWDAKGYFPNLSDAFKKMVDLELNPINNLGDSL